MISSFFYDGKELKKDLPTSKYKHHLSRKGGILWVDLYNPTPEELSILEKIFKFHPLAVEDCSKLVELPKVDEFDDYIFIVFHRIFFDFKKEELDMKELDVFLGDNFLVTVHNDPSASVDSMRQRVKIKPQLMQLGPDILMHGILDYAIDKYIPLLEKWDDIIEDLEDRIVAGQTKDIMEEIVHLKRNLLEFKKSIGPQRDILNKLSRRDYPFISDKASIYLKDVYDHIQGSYSELETYRELLSNAFEAYLSVLSNRMNVVIHRLTIIATIFMPLTFITGIYGMNFINMPEVSWQYGYIFALGLMVFVALLMVVFLKKKEWMSLQ